MNITEISMYAIVGFIILIVIFAIVRKRKTKKTIEYEFGKDFEAVPFDEITKDDLKNKVDDFGEIFKRKWKLFLGRMEIKHIDRLFEAIGKMPVNEYDEKTKTFTEKLNDDGKPIKFDYDLMMFRAGNRRFLLRFFGIGNSYIIINRKNIKGSKYMPSFRTFQMPQMDIFKYSEIWIEDNITMEYMNNLGIINMMQQLMTHVINAPNKTVHLENRQAGKERLAEKLSELDKQRYEEMRKSKEFNVS